MMHPAIYDRKKLQNTPMNLFKRFKAFVSRRSSHAKVLFRRRSSNLRLSPSIMDNFPQELVSHIFQLATDDVSSTDVATLVAITHTCKRWRTIAVNDGRLWTRIGITLPDLPRDLTRAVTFLLRSKMYPLIIKLDMRDISWDWDEDNHIFGWQDMQAIMRMFVVHIHRWKKFELLTDTWSPIFTFLWYTRHSQHLPSLETLLLSRCNMFPSASDQAFEPVALRNPINLFGGFMVPNLRNAFFVGVHIDWNSWHLQNLTRLDLKYLAHDVTPNMTQLRMILQASPHLVHFSFHGGNPPLDPSDSTAVDQHIILPNLKTFSFGFLNALDATLFLSLFDLPQINELILDDISAVLTPDVTHDSTNFFQGLIDRRQFRFQDLRTLQLIGVRCDTRVMVSFFSELYSLSHLSLSNIPDEILHGLGKFGPVSQQLEDDLENKNEFICQSLRELHCQDVDPDILIGVVRSRADHVILRPLERVTLEYTQAPAPGFYSPIYTQLAKAGIHVIYRSTRASQFSITPRSYAT